jgi:hypothetical protein
MSKSLRTTYCRASIGPISRRISWLARALSWRASFGPRTRRPHPLSTVSHPSGVVATGSSLAGIRACSSLVSNNGSRSVLRAHVVAEAPSGLLAIESKCTEYLSPKVVKFSERYETGIMDTRASGKWFAEMLRLKATDGAGYSLLDGAQLIKHALGLAHGRNNMIVNLFIFTGSQSTPASHPFLPSTAPKSLRLLSGSRRQSVF